MGSWLIKKKEITGNLENYHLVDVVTTSAPSPHPLVLSSVSLNWADTLNNVVVPISGRSDCF